MNRGVSQASSLGSFCQYLVQASCWYKNTDEVNLSGFMQVSFYYSRKAVEKASLKKARVEIASEVMKEIRLA